MKEAVEAQGLISHGMSHKKIEMCGGSGLSGDLEKLC